LPLVLSLKPKEKLFVNGAVIVNGDTRCDLTVLNDASILREKDIMREEDADTVCKRIYLLVQLMYIDPSSFAMYNDTLSPLLQDLVKAVPRSSDVVSEINEQVLLGHFYPAMKSARKLMSFEKELLGNVV